MKKFLSGVVLVSALALIVAGCSQQENLVDPDGLEFPISFSFNWIDGEEPCGDPQVVALYAGQFIDIGTVTTTLEDGTLCVDIQTTGNWVLVETHVAIGPDLDSLPQTGSGNPQVGHFLFQTEHDPAVTSCSYCTDPLEYIYEPGDIYIAVHASAILLDDAGNPVQEETAWADGPEFPGRSWATYFTYAIGSCPVGEECGIVLISPTAGEEFCFGFPLPITWEFTGEYPEFVNITLLRDGIPCMTITENEWYTYENWYEWIIEDSCESCEGETEWYTIQITDSGCPVVDESDPFLILPCGGWEKQ